LAEEREDADVETSSEGYALRFEGPVGRFLLERQAEATLDLLRSFPGANVLDVGGGHGQLTGPLVDAGYAVAVLGSDASCEARLREWTAAGRARFVAGDLLAPPLPDRSFDVVLSYRLLPHVRRWPELVAGLARLARRAVIVDYPTRRSVNAAAFILFGLKKGVEGNTRPFAVFSDAEIEAAFAAHGFAPTGRRPQFFFPMALHRGLRSAGVARSLEGAAAALGMTRAFGSPVILRLERRG
jgi:2-polyprenyl-3-methyl-5-hydroxy-6-metoxy-1,4-benzoquinol methylase